MTEKQWEKRLGVHTAGREEFFADRHHHPYEPTPYEVLERLLSKKLIRRWDCLLDYGCGKGRVGFFFAHETGCRTIGLDFQPELIRQAEENLRHFSGSAEFICKDARDYYPDQCSCFYFFNPFSAEILRPVLEQIFDSLLERPRKVKLFFYYPSDDFRELLTNEPRLNLIDEVDCSDLFLKSDPREVVLVFEATMY